MWDRITVDNTVNTFQNVSVYVHSGDITWGKCEYGIVLHFKIQCISKSVYLYTRYVLTKYRNNMNIG